MTSIMRFIHLGAFLLLASMVTTSAADPGDRSGRVARLLYTSGDVSVQQHGTGEWVRGTVIHPLTNGDNIWADQNSRAELNLGSGLMRINSESSLTLTNVDERTAQVELHQGVLNVDVLHLKNGEIYEIDTPNLTFRIAQVGNYRIDVPSNRDSTVVTVRKGEGQATAQGRAVSVHSGSQADFKGNSLEHQVREAPRQDGFDVWCQLRDRRHDQALSARYLTPDVVVSGDLDEYQAWSQISDKGLLWAPPTVTFDLAPYRYGYSSWSGPWVYGVPLGTTPFRYSHWDYYDYHAGPLYIRVF